MNRLHRVLLLVAVVLSALWLIPSPAGASAALAPTGQVLDQTVTLKLATVAYLLGTVVPLLTALATKLHASSKTKATVNLLLTILVGVLTAFTQHAGSLSVLELLTAIVAVYTGSVTTYGHVWKPLGAIDATAQLAPSTGVGKAAG